MDRQLINFCRFLHKSCISSKSCACSIREPRWQHKQLHRALLTPPEQHSWPQTADEPTDASTLAFWTGREYFPRTTAKVHYLYAQHTPCCWPLLTLFPTKNMTWKAQKQEWEQQKNSYTYCTWGTLFIKMKCYQENDGCKQKICTTQIIIPFQQQQERNADTNVSLIWSFSNS